MVARPNAALAQIHTQIMWNRLIAVVEEQAQTMLRTAFSTSVREAGDLSAGVFDRHGRMLAQAVTGTPGHVNSMANAVRHFLDVYPLATMKPGDHFITNDPWLTSGHLHDITVVTPSFYRGEAGRAVCQHDPCRGYRRARHGARRPSGVRGGTVHSDHAARARRADERGSPAYRSRQCARADCRSRATSMPARHPTTRAVRRLIEMMDEFEIANLDRLGDTIIEASREATLARIRALPKGTYRNQLTMDGYEKPLVLNAALTISDDGIHVDFDGTSPASSHGINVVYNYCLAYTAFGVKCLVAPDVPNNAGSLAPITVSAPEGCVLNVNRPWPVAARHTVGHMLPDAVFGCLHQAMAGGVPAEGASSLWNPQIFGGGSLVDEIDAGVDANALPAFSTVIFHCGGAGARPGKDGLSATAFPSGVRTIPVEATESVAPVVFYRREFRESSGGAGKISRRARPGHRAWRRRRRANRTAVQFRARAQSRARTRTAVRLAQTGQCQLRSGKPIRPKGRQTVPRARCDLPRPAGRRRFWRSADP